MEPLETYFLLKNILKYKNIFSSTFSDREKMYQKVYNFEISNVFFKNWEEYLMFYGINDRYSNMLWPYAIDRYLL